MKRRDFGPLVNNAKNAAEGLIEDLWNLDPTQRATWLVELIGRLRENEPSDNDVIVLGLVGTATNDNWGAVAAAEILSSLPSDVVSDQFALNFVQRGLESRAAGVRYYAMEACLKWRKKDFQTVVELAELGASGGRLRELEFLLNQLTG